MPNGKSHDREAVYEIVIEGRLDDTWSTWFHGFEVEPGPGQETLLRGRVIDQAALHGLLARVAELGLVLVSLRRIEGGEHAMPTGGLEQHR